MIDATTNRERDFRYLRDKHGEDGARTIFENLCATLCHAKYGNNAHSIRVSQGDGGIDSMVGDFSEPIHVYQCKYFLNGIGKSQKQQIRESFRTARDNERFTMKEWTLYIPCDLTQDEMDWWSHWKEDNEEDSGITISLCEGRNLLCELKEHNLYDEYFDIGLSRTLEQILSRLNTSTGSTDNAQLLRQSISQIAAILDTGAVSEAKRSFNEADAERFYTVDLSFPLMLRIISAGQDVPHREIDQRLESLCRDGTPAILTGHSGTGKSTMMLRAAVNWVRGGKTAFWISFREDLTLSDAKAAQFYRDLLRLVPADQHVLLCLDNPSEGPEMFKNLGRNWPDDNRIHLLMAERSNRLSRLTDPNNDQLYHWFDGAVVLAMLPKLDKCPFRLKGYQVEYIPDTYQRKTAILNKTIPIMARRGEVRTLSTPDTVTRILKNYNKPNVSLVELIYRAQFDILRFATKPEQLRLDWDEWRQILRKELKLRQDAGQLYGVIALCNLFEIPISISLFYRFFDIRKYDLKAVIAKWRMSKNVEPVIYRESTGTLVPKHDIIAELFFLFYRNTLPFNDLMAELLKAMNELEIDAFLERIVVKKSIQRGKKYPLDWVRYRDYLLTIYSSHKDGNLGHNEARKARLALGLLYTVPKNNSLLARETLKLVEDLAPPVDGTVLLASLYTEWGRLLADQNQNRPAEEKFRAVLTADPKNIHSRTELGRLLAWQPGREMEAEQFLRDTISIKSTDIQSRTELGRLLARQPGRELEAEQFLREILNIDPDNIQSRTELGRLLAKQPGRESEAEHFLRDTISIKPTDIQSRTELGRLLAKQPGRESEAEQFLQEILAIDQNNIQARTELGRLLAKQPIRESEAEQFLREAMQINPKHIQSRTELGRLLARQPGREANAEQFYREAIRIDPQQLHPRIELAKLCIRQNRFSEAEQLFSEVLRIHPGDFYAINGLKRLREFQSFTSAK